MKRAARLFNETASIGRHFGNGLHHFVRVVAHLPPFAWRSNIKSIASCASLFAELSCLVPAFGAFDGFFADEVVPDVTRSAQQIRKGPRP
jgi:hypothetical protein